MRVLVTGGSGFLGRSVVPSLIGRGHCVIALCRSTRAAEVVSKLGAEALPGDLNDLDDLDSAFALSEAEALVNLASLGFGHAPAIVAAAEEVGLRRAIFLSTTSIFTTLAAASRSVRINAETAVRGSGLQWTIIRPTMIYGRPGDRNFARLLSFMCRSPVVPVPGGGTHLIQPVHVDDLAMFIGAALESTEAIGREFNVAGPEPLSLSAIVEAAGKAIDRRPKLVSVPLGLAIALLRIYESLTPNPRIKVEQLQRLNEDKDFGIEEAVSLGYRPRPFADGIELEANLLGLGGSKSHTVTEYSGRRDALRK